MPMGESKPQVTNVQIMVAPGKKKMFPNPHPNMHPCLSFLGPKKGQQGSKPVPNTMDRRIKCLFLVFITLPGVVRMCSAHRPAPAFRGLRGVAKDTYVVPQYCLDTPPLFFIFGDFFSFPVFKLILPSVYTENP